MTRRLLLGVIVCFIATTGYGQEGGKTNEQKNDVPAGHSMHGEAFNEGPRQEAYLMEGTGKIHFPVTSKHPKVQPFVEQGIGQLHGYWYFEAERSFRQAATFDPDCAIAYWGMAMANANNAKRARGFIKEAVDRKDKASPREQMYIEALNDYLTSKNKLKQRAQNIVETYRQITQAFPDDLEAQAFLGYYMYKLRRTLKLGYEQVNAELNKVLDKNALHPVHHYRIHLWDYKTPANALNSAALCGAAAPAIAHMWHMPGHIYSRLKRYEEAVWQQEASARVDHKYMMKNRVMPDQIHNFAHNNEWLIRNLNHLGKHKDAVALAKNMTELPRHPKYNMLNKRRSAYYGRRRLFETLHRFELWDDLIALSKTTHLEPTTIESEQIKRLRHLGIAYIRSGNEDEGENILAELKERFQNVPRTKKKNSIRRSLEKAIYAVQGHRAFMKGQYNWAVAFLRSSGEDDLFLAKVRCLHGETEAALKMAESAVKSRPKQTHPLACQIEILWMAKEKEQAKKAFHQLRDISGSIQFGSPVFDRLAPIAKELGFPEDWRVKQPFGIDFGERPKLDDLGPFRWQPSSAPNWILPDAEGKPHSLDDYRGKPVLVIFYLGYGCLHCAEQIEAFIPATEKFKKEGIDIIAISTDDREGLKISEKNYKKGIIPFPLVANDKLDVFKAYRVYDDFEDVPLHGTFLIDEESLVRWQDISYEPFMDVDFALAESKRLLGLK